MQKFFSPGKLLLSGEYVVLDGATALALPTSYGQSLEVRETSDPFIKWRSLDHEKEIWFESSFSMRDLESSEVPVNQKTEIDKRLFSILKVAIQMNPSMLADPKGFEVTSRLDFPLNWGLGSSSTLIANLSKWLSIDAFQLLEQTFGGSGYDVAVALQEEPITYQLTDNQRSVLKVGFNPEFKNSLFFVHLNQKQNSRDSIKHYKSQPRKSLSAAIEKISALTHQMISCNSLLEFELLMEIHENIISQLIGIPKIKSRLFPDFKGALKSLGGWGGDFVLATGKEAEMKYFREKGFTTIVPYTQMIR